MPSSVSPLWIWPGPSARHGKNPRFGVPRMLGESLGFCLIKAADLVHPLPSPEPGRRAEPEPTVGFNTYPSAAACEEAASHLTPRPGARFACLPVAPSGGLAGAY